MGKLEKKEKSEAIDEEESNSQPDLMRSEEEKEENEDAEANEDLSLKIVEKAMLRYKVKEEQNADTTIAMNIDDSAAEKTPVEVPDNAVLRRLLRGPRYFDAPDKSWGTCYNCGEEGHAAVNCTSARRKKPCFVCGSFEHNAKHCTKVSGENCLLFYLNM
uniref:Zinc finger CCHC domain-containing protein 7 isoform X5 n=1 Tax=Nicotiana tabacum TaxID=4097 RepID=A0A1S4A3P6_TOBAC|nr:PREDICTED: zinc finger CCHC domain-containing protein 7 isoform X5 [Nicotiana tabacum]